MTSVNRILLIRHAEKPGVGNTGGGVMPDGSGDAESLTVRGWQHAGALARFFCSSSGALEPLPKAIFASGTGHGSKSKRPMQTVAPPMQLLGETFEVEFVTKYLKDDLQPLIDDVLSRKGPVLIAWEHKRIADLIGLLPNPPDVPHDWPDDRFDMVWVLDRTDSIWSFRQRPQLLLAGESGDPIT